MNILASKSQSLRRQFRRTLRDLFADGRAEYIRHRPLPASEGDGDPRWDLYAACESVAQASWQSHVVHGNTLTHDRVREYFHAAHAAAARIGMVDVNVLNVDGQPAAFLYGYHCQGNVTALRTGFDASIGGGLGSALMLKIDRRQLPPRRPRDRLRPRRTRTQTPAANADGIDVPAHVHADRFVALASGAALAVGEGAVGRNAEATPVGSAT